LLIAGRLSRPIGLFVVSNRRAWLVPELLRAGHQVVCLARSDASALAVKTAGAEVKLGGLADLDVGTRGASLADGVIYLGLSTTSRTLRNPP
jgi:uncharacterized protein YbjT (DUF2867 family)